MSSREHPKHDQAEALHGPRRPRRRHPRTAIRPTQTTAFRTGLATGIARMAVGTVPIMWRVHSLCGRRTRLTWTVITMASAAKKGTPDPEGQASDPCAERPTYRVIIQGLFGAGSQGLPWNGNVNPKWDLAHIS